MIMDKHTIGWLRGGPLGWLFQTMPYYAVGAGRYRNGGLYGQEQT